MRLQLRSVGKGDGVGRADFEASAVGRGSLETQIA